MSVQKILKVGNSLGITLPSKLVKSLSLRVGDQVDIAQEINSTLILTFIDSHQLSLGLTSSKNQLKKHL